MAGKRSIWTCARRVCVSASAPHTVNWGASSMCVSFTPRPL